jgi:type II secretory pathway pseudopilin PulG
MVVIAIIGTLMALLLPVFSSSHRTRPLLTARAEVKAIHQAMEEFHAALGWYPPDTDSFDTGVDARGGGVLDDNVDEKMICMYLGWVYTEPLTKRTYGPFFNMDPTRVRDDVYLDPWGNPYHVDAEHNTTIDSNGSVKLDVDPTGMVRLKGCPYLTSTLEKDRVEKVKVWSDGPDGRSSGAWSSHNDEDFRNQPRSKWPEEDQDNITSWAN